ncbi:AMP-binding protein [Longispora albida]|uniref:AMP-binding protein n=1 Tax=Longispora albida TaxID=203523 RepID=UPI000375E19F|nr:AMP-binding protein [Longispora albida]
MTHADVMTHPGLLIVTDLLGAVPGAWPADGKSIVDVFAEVVARAPGAPLLLGGEHCTPAMLDARANQYAHQLRSAGARQGNPVGVLLDGSPARLAAVVLGVWKTGAAYVPLDPAAPPGATTELFATAGAGLAVTEMALAARCPVPALLVDKHALMVAAGPAHGAPGGPAPHETACLLCTPHRPEAVAVSHEDLLYQLTKERQG